MNKEAQRIAIAEACGYRYRLDDSRPGPDLHIFVPPGFEDVDSEEAGIWHMDYSYAVKALPDYLADLNAMHEAEKTIRPPHRVDWSLWDSYIAKFEDDPHATAAHRAEAFLRTIGKWTGGEGGAG